MKKVTKPIEEEKPTEDTHTTEESLPSTEDPTQIPSSPQPIPESV